MFKVVQNSAANLWVPPIKTWGVTAGESEPELLKRSISSKELSLWLSPVDAEQMVVDACHSAASIESEGFKPGPLGSKGLGQLAYDKRMRVLAASQSDQAAPGDGRANRGWGAYLHAAA